MKPFFIFLELMIPIAAALLVLRKGSMAIVYIPFLLFANTLFENPEYIPANLYFFMFVALLLYFIFFNLPFAKRNVFSLLLVFYFFILLADATDIYKIRRTFLGVMWLFICFPLIPEIYKNYSRDKVFQEVSTASFLMMLLFVVNTILSTYFKYNPYETYGIKSGILFGKMSTDIYNIFPFAIFMIFRKGIKENNIYYLLLYLVSIFFVLLTLRRSVMALSVIGTVIVLMEFMTKDQLKKLFLYGFVVSVAAVLVVQNTSFADQFWERFEQRGLDNRPVEEESRFLEFGIVYKDLFVYYDYSPWFGFGLFDSNGNYGKRVFGDRSLHTDLTNIVHGSGLIGLVLYLLMVIVAFYAVWRRTKNRADFLQFAFIALCFVVFFINGRYTTTSAMLLMISVLSLPYAKASEKTLMNSK
jgi:O-antigen ligase